ncbi:3'(2'),5'-bisphosphate nucleotidase CysQ [Aquamicrobium soli]|jgi:3'(2'), 5'-bisphosphate nucleotidase|uniref:3'(2'),5'-bisphosphate nucleotidase CysQ n=1 Tax=Aquamicrobium soli TaxID=1811518 RepID=A0ABV7KH44_9HYPH
MATESELEGFVAVFERLAVAAGDAIMAVYAGPIDVERKADASPVTEADRQAEAIILAGLRQAWPQIPCVAEEEVSAGKLPVLGDGAFFLVDPLDGTKEFVNRREDFTVNIALIEAGVPVAGTVYAPARGALYSGGGRKAWRAMVTASGTIEGRTPISVRAAASPPMIVASRSHRTPETDDVIARFPGAELVSVGSSLKFCLLAAGEADLYPRLGRTMEWDTAAGDAVLRAAGGATLTLDGRPLAYGKRLPGQPDDLANPHFVCHGNAPESWRGLLTGR